MQGAGEPGASINYIRKRPTSFLRRETAAAVAYPLGGRAEADISGPLNESGTLRGRLLGAIDSPRGYARRLLQGALRRLRRARVRHHRPDAAEPRRQLPGDRRRQRHLGRPAALVQRRRPDRLAVGVQPRRRLDLQRHPAHRGLRLARARLRERLDRRGSSRPTSRTTSRTSSPGSSGMDADGNPTFPDAETGLGMSSWAAKYDGGYTQDSLNAVLNGDFQALGRIHEFVSARFVSKGEGTFDGYDVDPATLGPVGDVFDWDGSFPEPGFSDEVTQVWNTETTQVALYGTLQFHATDALALHRRRPRQLVGRHPDRPRVADVLLRVRGHRHALCRLHLRHQRDLHRLRQRHEHLQAAAGAGHRPQLSRPDLRLELRDRRQGGPVRRRALRLGGGVPDRPEGLCELRRLHRGGEPQRLRIDRRHDHPRLRDRGRGRDQRALERLDRLHLRAIPSDGGRHRAQHRHSRATR